MKTKKVLVTLLLATMLIATLVMPAFAATDINLGWNGNLNLLFTDPDAVVEVNSGGGVTGLFNLHDADDNPYSYGVDSINADLYATIAGGGEVEYTYTRTDSKVSMYGPAGQSTYSYIGTDGTGQIVRRTSSNYASLGNGGYGFYGSNNQFLATGDYLIQHNVVNNGLFAGFMASGLGSADIDHMTDGAGGGVNFGFGGGCYTDADVTMTGLGLYQRAATFLTSLDVANGGSALGAGSWSESWSFTNGFAMGDTSFTVK